MTNFEQWLERVYESGGDRETLDRAYNEWAGEYDQQLWGSGNPNIAISLGMTGRHVSDFNAAILDAGCGTGIMGQVLHQMGYQNIEGLDPSSGMLAMARKKAVDTKLHQLFLATEVELPPASYDAVVAAGVLTHGHAPPESLDGILGLTRPGGIIVFTLSEIAYREHGYADKISQLEANGQWRQVDKSRLFRTCPFLETEAHLRNWALTYRKC